MCKTTVKYSKYWHCFGHPRWYCSTELVWACLDMHSFHLDML